MIMFSESLLSTDDYNVLKLEQINVIKFISTKVCIVLLS